MSHSLFSFVCVACAKEQTRELSQSQNAFAAKFGIGLPCDACGTINLKGTYGSFANRDPSILHQWLSDEALIFLDQDEELILSEFPQNELERAFQSAPSKRRKDQIAIAIAIKLYDKDFSSGSERIACKKWLKENQAAWREHWDFEYVIEAVVMRLNLQ